MMFACLMVGDDLRHERFFQVLPPALPTGRLPRTHLPDVPYTFRIGFYK